MNFLKYRSDTKKMPKNAKQTHKKKESGFTLVEALIALTIVSLIGIPVFMVFSETVTFTGKIKDLTRWNRELIGLESVLRKSVLQIRIPFWISDIEVSEGITILKVPYWMGDVNSFLEIEGNDGNLNISTPDESTIFKGYEDFEFDYLKESQSQTVGISLVIKKTGKENIIFQCAFGSVGREVFNE